MITCDRTQWFIMVVTYIIATIIFSYLNWRCYKELKEIEKMSMLFRKRLERKYEE